MRPSKYKEEYCEESIEFLSDGYSVTALAGHFRVSVSTVYKWAEQHPDFSEALKTGQALAALWWERVLRNTALTGEGNASCAIFGVKNRSRGEWKDKVEEKDTEDTASPVKIEFTVKDARQPE